MAVELLNTSDESPLAVDDKLWPNETATKAVKVLHVINGEHYSGAERVQDLLALRLSQFGYEVSFACVKPDKFSRMRMAKESVLFEVPMRSRFDLSAVHNLRKLIKENQFQLVHAHTPRSLLLARLASIGLRIPLVYHVHSPTACDSTRKWKNLLSAQMERLSLIGVSKMIAVSQSLADRMSRQATNKRRMVTVPNGVPICGPLPQRTVPADRWVLGTVALFRPRKGLEVLVDALAALKSAGHDVHLHAVGGFETEAYQQEIFSRIKQLGIEASITWTGFTSDVGAELAKMDLFVLPSLFGEGLPMVVLEAMAAGVPVIATNIEGVPEAIRDGIDGLLAKPADSEYLKDVISQVISGEFNWDDLRQSAWQRQSENFSDISMARKIAEVYNSLLAR